MTTKPKAKKFRIRRSTPNAADAIRRATNEGAEAATPRPIVDDQMFAPADADDGFGDQPFATAAQKPEGPKPVPAQDEASYDEAIAAIRKEGLTGRQLRMACRVAQKHGLAPTSDFDAVRLLREQGIDPFQRANSLELVAADGEGGGAVQHKAVGVPQTVAKPQLPSTEVISADSRAAEIIRMQRDIVKRRRRKLLQLGTRLAFFVLLPTILAGYYFFSIATPMYSTKSEFVIQQSQNPTAGGGGGLGSLLGGSPLATSQDSIAVQGYLGSLEAMLRLEQDVGFISHFSAPDIDPLQRLEPNATKEQAYKVYKKKVKISYDPTEGIVKMEVVAADPQVAEQFALRLISYAEEQVDNLTQRLRGDQMKGADEAFADAEAKMLAAQTRVQELQERLGILDATAESGAILAQVGTFETQLQQKILTLQQF